MKLDLHRAEHLFERIERLQGSLPEVPQLDRESVQATLEPWERALRVADWSQLERRLMWDGVHPNVAALSLVETSGDLLDSWCEVVNSWLSLVLQHSGSVAAEPDFPFSSLLSPWVEEAAKYIDPEGARQKLLSPEAWRHWKRGLVRRLSWVVAPVLCYELELERSSGGREGACVRLERAWYEGALYEKWPLLVRYLVQLVEDWIGFSREWLAHLEADAPTLAQVFGKGRPLGLVVGLEPGLSDPHEGGRRVFSLRFSSGVELIYKPRPVGLEAAYFELLEALKRSGMCELPPAARVLARQGYGWMERVVFEPLQAIEEVEGWFRRAGTLVALAWVLGSRDLHAENIVATREGPVLVDAEMLLAPGNVASTLEPTTSTGLLADRERGIPGWIAGLELVERGALGPEERIVTGIGEELECQRVRRPLAVCPNLPEWEGRRQAPEAWTEALVEGFSCAAEALLARKEVVNRWLVFTAKHPVRVLFRPSQQYASLLALTLEPRYMMQGITAGLLREALLQPLVRSSTRPPLWSLVGEERRSLERLDIPVFRVAADSRVLERPEVQPIELASLSAMERARLGLESLESKTIHEESSKIRRNLSVARLSENEIEKRIFEASRMLVRALGRSSDFGAVPLSETKHFRELCLSEGLAGRAVFAVLVARWSGEASWRDQAHHLADALAKELGAWVEKARESLPLGALDGWGGVVWALSWIESLQPDPDRREGLAAVGRCLGSIGDGSSFPSWDLAGGIAGAVLGSLAAWQTTLEPCWLSLAKRFGSAIVQGAQRFADGALAWPSYAGNLPLAGMAHGASGIGRALDALGDATREPEWYEAAAAALRFERRHFDPSHGDWGVPGQNGQTHFLAAWCHGAGGVLAVRALRVRSGRAREGELQELEQAQKTLAQAPLPEFDHFCCGTAGRVAALTVRGEGREGKPERQSAACLLAHRALVRAEARGKWLLEPVQPGSQGRLGAVSLFRGYPGLVWALAGATRQGQDLPWLAVLELPGEWRTRVS
jgi:lantibiotic modifying enzyme